MNKRSIINNFPEHIIRSVKFLVLFSLTLAVYAQILDDPFHFDDAFYITNNTSIRNLSDWRATFKAISEFQLSRFVTVLTFAVNYYFHQLNVFGYHVVNFLIHVITACLVWRLGEILLVLSKLTEPVVSPINKKRADSHKSFPVFSLSYAPYWAALVFAVHPVNTQAVTYLSQRCESLATLFYLASVCFYLHTRVSGSKPIPGFTAAVICGLLGMLSKETVITLPITIVFLEFFFFSNKEYFFAGRRWLIFICICLGLVIPAFFQFNIHQILFSPISSQSHLGDVLTLPNYILTELRVFVRFLSLMIVPVGLNLDYDFPMSHTLFELDTFFSVLILVVIVFVGFRVRKKFAMLTFAIAWFFLTLSASFIPRAHVIFEHKIYLVLAGVLPGVVIWLFQIIKKRRVLIPALACVVLFFSLLTMQRNSVWRDEITLWTDVISKSPRKVRPHNHRGMAYKREGSLDLALADFNRVIELSPDDANGYLNRGNVFKLIGMNERALSDYSSAIRLDPQISDVHAARSSIFRRLGQLEKAKADADTAIMLAPGNPEYFSNRAHILQRQGDVAGAISDCKQAIRIQPNNFFVYNNRGNLFLKQGNLQAAMEDYDRAIAINAEFAEAYLNRAVVKFHLGSFNESLSDLQKAQKMGMTPKAEFVRQLNDALEDKNNENLP